MSEAKEAYYKLKHELEQMGHEGFTEEIDDYVTELEAETEQLKNSQSQKQKIKLHEKIEQLEVEKAEVLEVYKELLLEAMDLYNYYPNNFRKTVRKYFQIDIEFLAKHGVNL